CFEKPSSTTASTNRPRRSTTGPCSTPPSSSRASRNRRPRRQPARASDMSRVLAGEARPCSRCRPSRFQLSDHRGTVIGSRRRFLGIAGLSLAAGWIGTRDSVLHLITVEPFRVPGATDLAALTGATAWLNAAPLTATDLHGKVVLVDFWTYTCINWLRTLPYVRAWAAQYKEQGLV